MKYLDAFLGHSEAQERAPTSLTELTQPPSSVLSVPSPPRFEGSPVVETPLRTRVGALEPRPPCDGCGRTNWTVTVVMTDGERFCPRCLA